MESSLATADLVFVLESDGTITDYYQTPSATLYVPPDHFLGRQPADVMPAEVVNRFTEALVQARESDASVVFQYVLPMANGAHTFEARLGRLLATGRYLLVVHDLSDELKTSRRLHEQESLLATMFAQTTDAIVLVEPTNGRIVQFNDVACDSLGYSRAEFAALSIADIQLEQTPGEIQADIRAILAGEMNGLEARHRTKDGHIIDVAFNFRLIDHQGQPLISGVWQDISERKRREREQLARSEALRTQNRLLRTFSQSQACIDGEFATLAREITEPLARALKITRVSVWLWGSCLNQSLNNYGTAADDSDLCCIDLYSLSQEKHHDGMILANNDFQTELATIRSQRVINVWDALHDPRTAGYIESYLRPQDIRSMLDCAINLRGEIRGILRLEQVGSQRAWSPDEVRFGTQVADQLGIALLNAERLELVEELRRKQDFLTRAQAVSQTGHWHLDIPNNRLHWSEETYRIFGVAPELELTLEDFFALAYPKDRDAVQQAWAKALTGKPYRIQHRIQVNEELRWVEERAEIEYDRDGQPLTGLGIVQDITERVQTDLELEGYRLHLEDLVISRTADLEAAKTAAESANRAKSAFLSNMSHEIRTPMNAIVGYSHLIRRDPLTARQREQLDKLSASSQHLLQIINDVLDLSKIEAEKFQLETDDFEPARIIDNVCGLVAPTMLHKEIELFVHLGNLPIRVRGDSTRFGQIILNLLSNAAKFTNAGGTITILGQNLTEAATPASSDASGTTTGAAVRQLFTSSAAPLMLRFEIRDTGIGLHPEQLERLFFAFEQADTSTTRQYGGTGLGLAISKRLTELMGGRIGVHSKLGQGSCFWVEIPFAPARPAVVDQVLSALRGCRVLIIEDRVEDSASLVQMLEALHMNVAIASNGALGVTATSEAEHAGQPFDLLLIDWKMPELDGIATARKVRALALQQPPAMILITAFGDELPVDLTTNAGIARVLNKPMTPSKLRDALLFALGPRIKGHTSHGEPGAHGTTGRETAEPPAPLAQKPPGYRGRILLVEDNPINQDVTRELLTALGPKVTLAADGHQALERVRRGKFDLILMDIHMPVMDGLSATRAIRGLPGRQRIPIIAMTANVFDTDRRAALEAGMNDYIGKPIEPETLAEILRCWLPDQDQRRIDQQQEAIASAPSDVDASALALLEAVPGLNTHLGLQRVRGDIARYRCLLARFTEDHSDDAHQLNALLHEGNLEAIAQLAHGLKGVATTLGAERISRYATDLELAARSGLDDENLRAPIEQLGLTLQAFAHAIISTLPPPPTDACAED